MCEEAPFEFHNQPDLPAVRPERVNLFGRAPLASVFAKNIPRRADETQVGHTNTACLQRDVMPMSQST